MVRIAGIDRAKLLSELYNRARFLGLPEFHGAAWNKLSVADARAIIRAHGLNIRYLWGRGIMMNLSLPAVDELPYNRLNGEGLVEIIVRQLHAERRKQARKERRR
jgi:hypothetical protein